MAEMMPRPKKWRSKEYLDFTRRQRCLYAFRGRNTKCEGPMQAHHVRTNTDGGMGLTPSDGFALSLCLRHHQVVEGHPEWLFEDFLPFKEMVVLLMRFMERRREKR